MTRAAGINVIEEFEQDKLIQAIVSQKENVPQIQANIRSATFRIFQIL